MHLFGLIGYKLGYSFSSKFFTDKFEIEGLKDYKYVNFELDSISEFPSIFKKNPDVKGLNCTIPYKEQLMQYMDEIDEEAAAVGAVNTVKIIEKDGKRILKGYNTDVPGFQNSISSMLNETHKKALILGTGGASKAIKFVLSKLNIDYISASINEELFEKEIRYSDITEGIIKEHTIIINATPLGTFPDVDTCADIPYEFISSNHVLFDLVYNPEVSKFLQYGLDKGAKTKNGLEMLHGQAIASWEIWNS